MAKPSKRKETAGRDWVWGLGLLLAVILVYSPVWRAGFVWDDAVILTENPCIVGPLGLEEIWTTSAADICPLTLTTFWLEHKLWGLAPLPYHIVNVLLHAACAWVLWLVLRNLRIPGAWLGAALWALHPVQVESVAWVSEMKNTESGLFYLLAILFYLKGLQANVVGKYSGGSWNYGLTLLFAALAMASKSSTVILPGVLCLCAWWVQGRWQWHSLLKVGPVFLMSIAAGLLSMWTQEVMSPHDPQLERTFAERLSTSGEAIWFYLGKLIWPWPLTNIYPSWPIKAAELTSYLPLLVVIGLLVILWLQRKSRARGCFFAYAFFLINVLPVAGLIHMKFFRYAQVADHLLYLPSMGPLVLIAAGITWCADLIIPGKFWLKSIPGAGVAVLLGILSWQQSWVYENEETFWNAALARNPDSWAIYNNLGNALLQKGDIDNAINQYQKGLALDPDNARTHNNLGNALLKKGRIDEAIEQYQKALARNPGDIRMRENLADALLQKGQLDDAIAQYRIALDTDPLNPSLHKAIGNILAQKGSLDEAIVEYQKCLDTDANDYDTRNKLGVCFARKGDLGDAIAQFQEALLLRPDYPDAQKNLTQAQALILRKPVEK